jgi:hypothetical protein
MLASLLERWPSKWNVGAQNPSGTATRANQCRPQAGGPQLGDIKALSDDVKGLQGPKSWWEGKTPLGLGLLGCL